VIAAAMTAVWWIANSLLAASGITLLFAAVKKWKRWPKPDAKPSPWGALSQAELDAFNIRYTERRRDR
jgi:hypothetical protein